MPRSIIIIIFSSSSSSSSSSSCTNSISKAWKPEEEELRCLAQTCSPRSLHPTVKILAVPRNYQGVLFKVSS